MTESDQPPKGSFEQSLEREGELSRSTVDKNERMIFTPQKDAELEQTLATEGAQPQGERQQYYGLDEPGPDYNRKTPTEEELVRDRYADEKGWIKDSVQAEVMAYAGKEQRDEAAHLRKLATEWQEDKLDDTADLWQEAGELDKQATEKEEAVDGRNRVADEGKAEVMAYAEDDERTEAARLRKGADALAKLPTEIAEIDQQLGEKGPIPKVDALFGQKRKEQQKNRDEHVKVKEDLLKKREEVQRETKEALSQMPYDPFFPASEAYDSSKKSTSHETFEAQHKQFLQELRNRAEKADQRAAAIGEWAGVLHEHPPSDRFLESASNLYNVDEPYELFTIEYQTVPDFEEVIDRAQATLKEKEENGFEDLHEAMEIMEEISDDYHNFNDFDERVRRLNLEARPQAEEIKELISSAFADDMTIAGIKARALDVMRKLVEVEKADLGGYRRLLRDIKNGRASDPDYTVEAESGGEENEPAF